MKQLPLAIALFFGAVTAATAATHGISPGDMDKNAQACTNFFDYANGTWRKDNAIPEYMDRWSRRWQSGEVNKEHVRDILTETSAKSDWPKGSAQQLSGDYYAACMNEDAVNQAGITPIKPLLDEVAAIKTRAQLQAAIGHMQLLGITTGVGVYAAQDLHDPTQMVAHVVAGGLGLPDRDYYLKTEPRFVEARAKYHEHVAKMFILAGSTPAAADTAATSVFELEKRLAVATLDNVAQRDPLQSDHKTTFAGLQKMAPDFDWARYFDDAKLPRIDLNVTEPAFVAAFGKEVANAPFEQWRDYLRWHVLDGSANMLSAPFVKQNFEFFSRYLSGATEMKPRWKQCAENTDSLLGEALGKAYIEKYFPAEGKARMEDMVKNLRLAMQQTIDSATWMSPETKAKAQEKLAAFNSKVAYPDKWKTYNGVVVARSSYYNDAIGAIRWNIADNLAQAGKPVDRSRWGMTPPTSNAYYDASMNEIVFPAGILQPPAFDVTATDAVNYGAIGVVIGHEISHGFDDQGAQFDGQGRLSNWWTAADHKQFEARGQCVVNQFDSYFIEPGIHHNGKLVLGESIGDLGGAKLAYLAYKISREGKGPEATIDGFTPEQQFFLAWGQWRGDETRPETQRTMVQGDPHPIAKFRVNGPLSNLPAFRAAFGCKAGDPMVRPDADRCEVW